MMQCDYFQQDKCQSCRWLAQTYPRQLAAKSQHLHDLLDPFQPRHWYPPLTGPQAGFRNKAKMAVLGTRDAPLLGIVNRQGEAISLCDCPLYPRDMQAVLHSLQAWVRQARLPPYQVDQRQGEVKFLLLTRSEATGEYLLRLVLRSEQLLPRIRQYLPPLQTGCPAIKVVSVNIQPVHMAILEGEKEIFLTADTRLPERLNGVPLYIRPKSFFQTNPTVAAALYKTARDWVAAIAPATLWDMYCGVGGFALHCATPGMKVTGMEIEAEAIACAQRSAREMCLHNIDWRAADLTGLAPPGVAPEMMIVNPPRRGLGPDLCARIGNMAPAHILYSSCHGETLALDLSRLPGYQVMRVQLLDMFPHTPHYEALVELKRRDGYK